MCLEAAVETSSIEATGARLPQVAERRTGMTLRRAALIAGLGFVSVTFFGEVAFMLWLLIWGWRIKQPAAQE